MMSVKMFDLVATVIAAGAGSLLIGLTTVLATLISRRGGAAVVEPDELMPPTEPMPKPKIIVEHDGSNISEGQLYWSFALWALILGVVLIFAPDNWFGPSWRYFDYIPHNGFSMGVTCVVLGLLQAFVLWRNGIKKYRDLSVLFFLSGFVYWTAGMMLGTEGLLGHQGLMEAPFMLYAGGHQFAHSASLSAQERLRNPKRRKVTRRKGRHER